MSRFFVDPSDVTERYIYLSDRGDLHHMKKVLRLSIGDELDVSDGTAPLCRCSWNGPWW